MSQREWRYLLLPVVVAAVLFLPSIGQWTLYHPDEARFALLARGMVEEGHWWVPYLEGQAHMEKPPLFVWAIALLSLVGGGVTEFTSILPAALSGIGGVAGTFVLGRRLFGLRAGLLASLILATSPGYFWHARIVFADMTVTLFIIWSAWAFWGATGSPRRQRRWMALFYLFVGLAFSAKGPTGLMPILAFGAFLFAEEGWAGLRTLRPLMGIGILALVSAPWAIPFALHRGETNYVHAVLLKDYLGWYFGRWKSLWELFFVLGPLFVAFLPWSLFLPVAFREGYLRAEAGARRKFTFLLFWVLAYLIVITLMAEKRTRYLLPMYPALALMVGWFFDRWAAGLIRVGARLYAWIWAALGAAATLALALPLNLDAGVMVVVPSRVDQTLLLVGLLVAGGILGAVVLRQGRIFTGFSVIWLTMGLVLFSETKIFVPNYNQAYDLKGFSRRVLRRVRPEDQLFAFQLRRKIPYEFYLKRTLGDIEDPEELTVLLSGSRPVYFLVDERHWRKFEEPTGEVWPIVDRANYPGPDILLGTNSAASSPGLRPEPNRSSLPQ